MSDAPLLFVYGTLMSGFDANGLLGDAELLGPAVTHGVLWDVGHPALIQGTRRIAGELYRMSDDPLAFKKVDAYEGCDRGLFVRLKVQAESAEAVLCCGAPRVLLGAWAYIYALRPMPKRAVLVDSGDWRAYIDVARNRAVFAR